MYEWSASHIDGVKFFKVTENEVESHINTFDIENRYSQKYNGIQSHHISFIPKDGALEIHRVFADEYYAEVNLDNLSFQYDDIDVFKPGIYAACAYDSKWYISNILDVSKEFGDVFVDFMKTERKSFTWPSKKDQCWVPTINVICIITTLVASRHGACSYEISDKEFQNVAEKFKILVDLKIQTNNLKT